jgi:TetR/AcrR family fatty acid metabolism transcriptional regulator
VSRQASILAAATRVFAASGYHGARVSEVARAAGVADGTIYLYFRSKRDLLVALFEQGFDHFLAGLDAALEALCAHHLGYLGARYDLAVVTQVEMRHSDPDLRQAIGRIVRPYFDRIEAVVRPCDCDVRIARRMVFGTLDEHVTAWVRSGGRFDLAALAPEVARLLTRGLGGRP